MQPNYLFLLLLLSKIVSGVWYIDNCQDILEVDQTFIPTKFPLSDSRSNIDTRFNGMYPSTIWRSNLNFFFREIFLDSSSYCSEFSLVEASNNEYALKCTKCIFRSGSILKIGYHSVGFLEEYARPLNSKQIKKGVHNPAKFLIDMLFQLFSLFKNGYFYKKISFSNIGITANIKGQTRRFTLIKAENVRRVCKDSYFSFLQKTVIKQLTHSKFFQNLSVVSCIFLNIYQLWILYDQLNIYMMKLLKKQSNGNKASNQILEKISRVLEKQKSILFSFIMNFYQNPGNGITTEFISLKTYINSELTTVLQEDQIGYSVYISTAPGLVNEPVITLNKGVTVHGVLDQVDLYVSGVLENNIGELETHYDMFKDQVPEFANELGVNTDLLNQVLYLKQVPEDFDQEDIDEKPKINKIHVDNPNSNIAQMRKDMKTLPKEFLQMTTVDDLKKADNQEQKVRVMATLVLKATELTEFTQQNLLEGEINYDIISQFVAELTNQSGPKDQIKMQSNSIKYI